MLRTFSRPSPRAAAPFVCMLGFLLTATSSFSLYEETAAAGSVAPVPPKSAAPAVRLGQVDSIIQQAIADGLPGAVLLVGHNGSVIYRKAYGNRALEPKREAMTIDTIFDMASLTKVVATTTAVMQLFEQGKIRMNDPVAKYVSEFAQNGKEDVTIRQLMTHFSGLAPDVDLTPAWDSKESAYRLSFAKTPTQAPGSAFVYSDTNFIVLGALIERVSGETLDAYTIRHIFTPLKMTHTRFAPPALWRAKIAPTEYDENNHMIRGVVHDPRARRMAGVAGHAGLFSTADDLSKFAQTLLNGGGPILALLTVAKMTQPEQHRPPPFSAASAGTSTRPSPPTAATCFPLDLTATLGSPAPLSGSIPPPRPTSFF